MLLMRYTHSETKRDPIRSARGRHTPRRCCRRAGFSRDPKRRVLEAGGRLETETRLAEGEDGSIGRVGWSGRREVSPHLLERQAQRVGAK